ncbi:helix-turn-helix transcriptional regulator [Arhodomonas sp. AD133]|uniref:helix-turn-helix transcriptional regulator n=1 Tax=Arhodomonas sp. AD133 TaxID=3415009 RepID=UPI003EB6D713
MSRERSGGAFDAPLMCSLLAECLGGAGRAGEWVRMLVNGFRPRPDPLRTRAASVGQLTTLTRIPAPSLRLLRDAPDLDTYVQRWNALDATWSVPVRTRLMRTSDGNLHLHRHRFDGLPPQPHQDAAVTALMAAHLRGQGLHVSRPDAAKPLELTLTLGEPAATTDFFPPGDATPSVWSTLTSAPDAHWTLARTATRLGVSARTLQRQLAREGVAIRQLKVGARVTLASGALIADAPSVTELAHALGFSDSAHFSHAFHRASGVTPSRYRAIAMA